MKKISELQCLLSVIYVAALMIANVVEAKQSAFFGGAMTCGNLVFPITYILSDVFSEVYGYRFSRKTCIWAFAMNILMVCVFQIAIATPAPGYWENQQAFATVLGSTPRIVAASMLAFLFGDFVNDVIFQKMKERSANSKSFGARAIISSVFGELADSLVFFPIAFIGEMPIKTLAVMATVQVLMKVGYEIVMLPITRSVVKKVSAHEARV